MNLADCRHPDSTALVLDNGRQVAYAELQYDLKRLVEALPERGILFCLCNNDYPSLLIYLAALEANVVPLLLPGTLQEAALRGLLAAYSPTYVFHNRGDLQPDFYGTTISCHDGYQLRHRAGPGQAATHPALRLLLATSGSTGSPKLVRLSGENLVANADSIIDYLAITADERAITSLPMHYSYGLSVINTHLRSGASLILTGRSLMDPEFWRLMERHAATSFSGVPYTYEMLLKLRIERLRMPSVRTMTQAGGRLAADKTRLVAEACADRGIRFFTMYGQTEATARMAYVPCERAREKAGSIGIPIPRGQIWIEDENGDRIDKSGVAGQLVYAGPNVSMGYANSIQDLMLGDTNRGVLRTGDLATFDDEGYFYICGRMSRFVKVFGVRISLDSVEHFMTERGVACAATGDDDHLLICITGEGAPDTDATRDLVAEALSINKAGIVVRAMDSIPLLESGKVDYRKLSALCQ